MFNAKEWKEFLDIGARWDSFDWDISMGYILFGSCGMSIWKLQGKQWRYKQISDWRNKNVSQVNAEIKAQDWTKADGRPNR